MGTFSSTWYWLDETNSTIPPVCLSIGGRRPVATATRSNRSASLSQIVIVFSLLCRSFFLLLFLRETWSDQLWFVPYDRYASCCEWLPPVPASTRRRRRPSSASTRSASRSRCRNRRRPAAASPSACRRRWPHWTAASTPPPRRTGAPVSPHRKCSPSTVSSPRTTPR